MLLSGLPGALRHSSHRGTVFGLGTDGPNSFGHGNRPAAVNGAKGWFGHRPVLLYQ